MHFMIYVPEKGAHPERLADLGLSGLVDGAFAASCIGPDATQGTVFGWRPDHGRNRGRLVHCHDSNAQTWRPAAAMNDLPQSRYWVGTVNGQEPEPDDLLRTYPYRGTKVKLSESQSEWWLPVEADLPYDCKLQDDGSWRFVPQRRFESFCAATASWREMVETAHANIIHLQMEVREFVAESLAVNYRLCPEIEDSLGLWTSSRSGTILPAFLSILKMEWTTQ